jgi:hypothetical protein
VDEERDDARGTTLDQILRNDSGFDKTTRKILVEDSSKRMPLAIAEPRVTVQPKQSRKACTSSATKVRLRRPRSLPSSNIHDENCAVWARPRTTSVVLEEQSRWEGKRAALTGLEPVSDVLTWPKEKDLQDIILPGDEKVIPSTQRSYVKPSVCRLLSGGVKRMTTKTSVDFDDVSAFDIFYEGQTSATRRKLENKGSVEF